MSSVLSKSSCPQRHSIFHLYSIDDDGDSFEIKSPPLMTKQVLPQHFKHNNFSSFQRQLNYFGFKKVHFMFVELQDFNFNIVNKIANLMQIGKGDSGCMYQHEKFRRGFPELVLEIRRKTNSGKHGKSRKKVP